MKTPEEIKDGLECQARPEIACSNNRCGYYLDNNPCNQMIVLDALAYIKQLEREKEVLKEFVRDKCWSCKHKKCSIRCEPCKSCTQNLDGRKTTNNWEWRGVEEDA